MAYSSSSSEALYARLFRFIMIVFEIELHIRFLLLFASSLSLFQISIYVLFVCVDWFDSSYAKQFWMTLKNMQQNWKL